MSTFPHAVAPAVLAVAAAAAAAVVIAAEGCGLPAAAAASFFFCIFSSESLQHKLNVAFTFAGLLFYEP